MISEFFFYDPRLVDSFLGFIKALIGPGGKVLKDSSPYSKVIAVVLNKVKEKVAEIIKETTQYDEDYYQLIIYDPLSLDPRFYDYKYLIKFSDFFDHDYTYGFFPFIEVIYFKNLRLKPLSKLLSLEKYSIELIRIESGTENFKIELEDKDFPIVLTVSVDSVSDEYEKQVSIAFPGRFEVIDDKINDILHWTRTKHVSFVNYSIFQVLFDIVDSSIPEYSKITSIYLKLKSEFEQAKKEFYSKEFYRTHDSLARCRKSSLKVVFPIKRDRLGQEYIEDLTIIDRLRKHFSRYSFSRHYSEYGNNLEGKIKHPKYHVITYELVHETSFSRVVFRFDDFKENYQSSNVPLLDIFSFYEKYSKDPKMAFFTDIKNFANITFRNIFVVLDKYINLGSLHVKGFRFEDWNKIVIRRSENNIGHFYATYELLDREIITRFDFYLLGVINNCASKPATYIYNLTKKMINEIFDKKVINPYTGEGIDLFSVPLIEE